MNALIRVNPALLQQAINGQEERLLVALIRCLEAQPNLVKLINFSSLFAHCPTESTKTNLMLANLQSLVCPERESGESAEKKESRMELVDSLLFNKYQEQQTKASLTKALILRAEQQATTCVEGEEEEESKGPVEVIDGIVGSAYLQAKANEVMTHIEGNPQGHFAVCGPQASGKISLVKYLMQLYNRRYNAQQQMIVVTCEETFDSKNLVGTYVCSETGEFVFKKGPLTVAAEQGLWLVLKNIEDTPSDLLSFLLPLVEQNKLQVTSTFTIIPKLGFRIFCVAKTETSHGKHEDIQPLLSSLHITELASLYHPQECRSDFEEILVAKYPELFRTVGTTSIHSLIQAAIDYLHTQMATIKLNLLDYKPPSVTNLLGLYRRIQVIFQDRMHDDHLHLSQAQRQTLIEEITDVYLSYLYDQTTKRKLIAGMIKEVFNRDQSESTLDNQVISEYITDQGREHGISKDQCFFGRASLTRGQASQHDSGAKINKFVYTGSTVRFLEQIATAVTVDEPVLLVGETGTGKTTVVQELAQMLGKKLHVFNMNQNTDSSDLLGGFKPVDLKYLLTPIYGRFRELFCSLLNASSPNNKQFLELLQRCYEQNKVNDFIKCLQHGMKSVKGKQAKDPVNINQLDQSIKDLQKRAQKLESGGGFIFQFVEGTLIKSIQNGDWILLDEINLAPDSVLNRLATIILGNNIMLNERADIVETTKHSDFRVFMCMNPPYTSAGKKQLPYSLRSRLCELYVAELENQEDLWQIIDRNTKSEASLQTTNCISETHKRRILEFYMTVKLQVQRQTKRGNIGLRNLCRALFFIKSAVALNYPVTKAIYDSLFTCFASHLDDQLQSFVKSLIFKLFEIKSLPTLQKTPGGHAGYECIEDCVVRLGSHKPEHFSEKNFILTKTFKGLLRQLASVVSVSSFAIILEGPTSAGKTSCVQYLAAVTHNKVIRINNHMHTDVQEYLGSYVPDSVTGKLTFQEGVLVEAVRKGYWVILDELNLAPSEVLEALNRLLDDNRELHIVETQKTIKAHPNFRIFATQNPTEGYGGRKELSEAFKNRFVLIRVGDVPTEELKEILVQKCSLPLSRASLMVKVMENLQIFRSSANLFSGKNSIITVRDLLKWAGRINSSNDGSHVTAENIALEGFLLLGERSRNSSDKEFIKETIEKAFGVKINEEKFYQDYMNTHLKTVFDNVPASLNLPKIIQSRQLIRLSVLIAKCLKNKEPVLLVGDTGCGKTTLCQVFASEVTKQPLFSINCHQNTETSDFIGCMRTRKNLQKTQDDLQSLTNSLMYTLTDQQQTTFATLSLKKRARLLLSALKLNSEHEQQYQELTRLLDDLNCVFEWHDGILVEAMTQGGLLLIDEISLANDSVLERLNSVFEEGRTLVVTEKSSAEAVKVQAHPAFNMVATMNPSGDFGKKELSPALRNRMTEVWVESYFNQQELAELFRQSGDEVVKGQAIDDLAAIDLHLIVSELSSSLPSQVPLGIFNMVGYVTFVLADRYFALHRKAMSIRDILSIITFIQQSDLTVTEAFRHAIELVIIDGVCLGIDVAGNQESEAILKDCRKQLDKIITELFGQPIVHTEDRLINTDKAIGVEPFLIDKLKSLQSTSTFAFDAATTKSNLKKLLRAFSLGKPILIEGPPGVGKTALVENLARETGRSLVRVNLSEQTDMMDLLGSEYPVSSSNASSQDGQDEDDIQFRWSDGVLLQAIKEGHWLLIDEMNLAQQSILEGLNAILDHRRTVYIPELNREFTCHPNFFVFACQNPSQSAGSTTGRKTLPKSFLNRFIKIYLDDLTRQDYELILNHIASDMFPTSSHISNLLNATQQIGSADQCAVNMRDLSRFLKLLRKYAQSREEQQASILQALTSCYFMRQQKQSSESVELAVRHGLVQAGLRLKTPLVRALADGKICFQSLTKTVVHGESKQKGNGTKFNTFVDLKGKLAGRIQALCDCLDCNIPLLITTDDPPRIIKTLSLLASVSGQNLARILLSEKSDTTQLLGCFEQTSTDISSFMQFLSPFKSNCDLTEPILELESAISLCPQDKKNIHLVEQTLKAHQHLFGEQFSILMQKLKAIKHGSSRFEWVDSVLVNQIEKGGWAVFENANLCNPSILDRLNSLLEEGNYQLSINEQGLVNGEQIRNVKAHQDFRAVFVISQRTFAEQGKDVSRALRNRCQELWINFSEEESTDFQDKEVTESVVREGSADWQLTQLQADHDLVLMKQSAQAQGVKNFVPKLGKRPRGYELENYQADLPKVPELNQAVAQVILLFEFLAKMGHPNQIQCKKLWKIFDQDKDLKQAQENLKEVIENENLSGFEAYIQYLVIKLQSDLKLNLSHQIVDSNMIGILNYFTRETPSSRRNFFILLRQILVGPLRASFIQPFALYLLSHIDLPEQFHASLTRCVDSEIAFLTSKESLATLEYLENMQPNSLTPSQIKLYQLAQNQRHQLLDDQCLYLYKVPREELLTKPHTSRVSLSLAQLTRGQTVLMLDKDKELISQQRMIEQLEQVPDQSQLLETPNLLLIPHEQSDPQIVISQSYLYESLCFIKDWRALQSANARIQTNLRLNKLPVVNFNQDPSASVVARKIALNQLEHSYGSERFDFASQTIAAILQDEQSICLRDLPAYYACATSLLYKMKETKRGQIDDEFKNVFNQLVADKLTVYAPSRLANILSDHLSQTRTNSQDNSADAVVRLAMQAVDTIDKAFALMAQIPTVEMLQALFILPLETQRQAELSSLAQQECNSMFDVLNFQLRDSKEAEQLTQPQRDNLEAVKQNLKQLQKLQSECGDSELEAQTQKQLKQLLSFVGSLQSELKNLASLLEQSTTDQAVEQQVANSCQTVSSLLLRGLEAYFPSFNHIVKDLFVVACAIEESSRQYLLMCFKLRPQLDLAQSVINFKTDSSVPLLTYQSKLTKTSKQKSLYERQLLWSIKFSRSQDQQSQQVLGQAFDYFVRREIKRKMKEEERDPDEQIFFVPFKVKEQMPPVVGKAMDEWTKEDVAKMEAEADKAIEENFPSYFDEVQKTFFESEYSQEGQRMTNKEKQALFSKRPDDRDVTLEEIFQEILEVTDAERSKSTVLKERLEIVSIVLECDGLESHKRGLSICSLNDPMQEVDQQNTWQEDACSFLQQQLDQTIKLKQLMNISDVNLARNYNFYHSPFPEEVKLVLQPLQTLLMRLRDIVIRDEYESPILNESMFLANYMLSCFNAEHTPLMKILMSIEFLLSKLEEWENTYASKRLNSVEANINTLKQIVIRLRKIQILSWRNLLNWKKEQFIKEDFMNYVRLSHTLERQVFDPKLYKKQKKGEQSVEMKMFELLDLFMRDSTLGLFSGRLSLIKFLLDHFSYKQRTFYQGNSNQKVALRLGKLVNALDFVYNYYSQFRAKLQQTVERLDGNARDKVRTLIDVSKWTVQKFSIIKNNIDKTHRQLYKACKDEEEALLQNVQTLVIASSRKKYATNDQLLGLDPELKTESVKVPTLRTITPELTQEFTFLKSLQFLEESRIKGAWPTAVVFEEVMSGFFERLADVRAVNKKHIQKRAFYDLLRYFKSQGIRNTQSEDVQPLLIDNKVACSPPDSNDYFFKAYEAYLMLSNSSQVEGNNDFQNPDIRRVQGFSQNLLFKVCKLNQYVQHISAKVEKFADLIPTSLLTPTEGSNYLSFDRSESTKARKLKELVRSQLNQLVDKLQAQALQADSNRKTHLKQLISLVKQSIQSVPQSHFEEGLVERLDSAIESVCTSLYQLLNETFATERDRLISSDTISTLQELKTQVLALKSMSCESDAEMQKKLTKCEAQVKIIYQDIVKALLAAEDKKEAGTRKSSLEVDTTNPTVIDQPESLSLSMDQQVEFTKVILGDVFGSRMDKLIDSVKQTYDIPSNLIASGDMLKYTTALLAQLLSCLKTVVANQVNVLHRMTKFSYLTQRVFLYLIYQGFCGVDEPDDPDEQPPSDLEEEDGQGLGDGQGGAQNITDQIEHEEQLEGLKNYESEEEKEQQDGVSHGEDDNDFDMKNDFDGNMDSEKEEEKHDQKDEEDELDNVDDMLDNQLWDKNMEDMEKKEQEEQEQQKEDNREVDLGERDIAEQNQIDKKENDVAEGDFDQKEHDSDQDQDKQDQEMAEAQSEGGERHESEAEQEEDSQDENVPLDKDSVKAEPDEEFSEDAEKSESELQSDADKASENSEEAEGQEGSEHDSLSEREEDAADDDLDVKPECNQAVLEDDQIQAKEDNTKKEDNKENTQANLKKQESANKEQSESNKQENKQDNQSSSQVDPNGQDMLYQLTQKLQQRQQEKQQQPKPQEPQSEEAKKTVDQPNLKEQNPEAQDEPMADEGEAMEYEQDQNAQEMQGKLCTDQVQEDDQKAVDQDQPMEEDMSQEFEPESEQKQETNQKAEMTGAQVKQAEMAKAEAGKQQKEDHQMEQEEESKEELKDLIGEYMDYLTQKQELAMDADEQPVQPDTAKASTFKQDLAPFDLLEQKQTIRELFNLWAQNQDLHKASIELLAKFKNQTQHVSASLCEQLRIILEPQLSQNLQGDYKTGKRLNMKKVISFIASHYRNDKIWLRRTLPSKRDYKILIAIDDTLSMKENNLGFFSLEAMIALTEALNKLEVGKVAVARIRDRMDLLHGFDENYTSERAGFIVSQFEFAHCASTSADHAMANFVCDANKLLDMQNHGGSSVNCPFVIVLSDGRFNKENVRRYIREAKEKRYLFIFIVLDKPKLMENGKTESGIMSLRSAVKNEQGSIKLVPYLKDFPFDYYCLVQDTQQLPNALGTILVQWYQMVAASGQK